MPALILGSSSPYRRALLERLSLKFSCHSPDIDETPLPNEDAQALTLRLAQAKARALETLYPRHLIIGSDQVAVLNGAILGKPGTHARAFDQLKAASGQCVSFLTALTLLNTETGRLQSTVVPFKVYFRHLPDAIIERYLRKEMPYDCAGSFKAEGLGVSLFSKTQGEDATSLVGLPLIALVDMLHQEDIAVP